MKASLRAGRTVANATPRSAALVLGLVLLLTLPRAFAGQFPVTTIADGGPGSLRMAMTLANTTPGRDTIPFSIPGTGPHTLVPLLQLPQLSDPAGVLIDGLAQPGSTVGSAPPATLSLAVILDGVQAGMSHGIWIVSSNNVIRGLVIHRFAQDGVRIQATTAGTIANIVEHCCIGTDASGAVAMGNGRGRTRPWAGVDILADPSTLGVAHGNVVRQCLVSGNWSEGVSISSCPPADVHNNHVDSCFIGTDRSGLRDLGNAVCGVYIGEAAHHNFIVANVIAGNDTDGVSIVGYVDPVTTWHTHNNQIIMNRIGIAGDGVTPLPNSRDGVSIGIYGLVWKLGYAPQNFVGSNTIAHNGRNGVTVWEHFSGAGNGDQNRISANVIFGNAGLGIDLGEDGVTANDPGDVDNGANQQLNSPVIAAARISASKLTVNGTLSIDSDPTKAVIEVFQGAPCRVPCGQARAMLGIAVPDAAGNWSLSVPGTVSAGDSVTATATDQRMNTSEFSANAIVTAASGGVEPLPQLVSIGSWYPDPCTDGAELGVRMDEPVTAIYTLVVSDAVGRVCAVRQGLLDAGTRVIRLSRQDLPASGAYHCVLSIQTRDGRRIHIARGLRRVD